MTTKEFDRIAGMRIMTEGEEKARAWLADLTKYIQEGHTHCHLHYQDLVIYWRNCYWDIMYHRNYGPNAHLLRELDQLRLLNHKQAGKIMELELDNRCLRRVHESKYKET